MLFLHPMVTIFCIINVCVTQHKCSIQSIVDFQLIRIDTMHIILRVFSSTVNVLKFKHYTCHLPAKKAVTNSADPDQTASEEAV